MAKELTAGTAFGENALKSVDKLRTAGIATKTDCIFVTMTTKEYELHCKHLRDLNRDKQIKWLKSTAFFSSWTQTLIQKLYYTMKEVQVSGGQIMTHELENEPCYKFWVILQGEFQVSKRIIKPAVTEDPRAEFLR